MVRDILKLKIQNELDIVLAQKRSKEICGFTGMNLASQTKFSTAVSEICRNVYEHVGVGYVQFAIVQDGNSQLLEAKVTDFGRGISNVAALMAQPANSSFQKGSGIANSKKLVAYLDIQSEADKGTIVILRNPISSKSAITGLLVKEWNDYFRSNHSISAYEELKNQNLELIELTDTLQHQNLEIQQQLEEIKRLNTELDQFSYIASHDLKSPLKNILGLSDMLAENLAENDMENAVWTCETIRAQAAAMDKLIADILSYSKIGRQNIEKTTVNVHELVQEVLKSLPAPKTFKFVLEQLPVLVTEEVLLFQVFSNLVANGIKHNHNKEDGIITIGSTLSATELLFFVKDNGPGISKLNMKRIFKMFESTGNVKENTGIGLSIVKSIIQLKKTRIWVESDGINGSVFNFTWPLEEVQM